LRIYNYKSKINFKNVKIDSIYGKNSSIIVIDGSDSELVNFESDDPQIAFEIILENINIQNC
jgi:hypothetical protein